MKKLQNVKQLGTGVIQARCPACAKSGSDKAGEHLRVYPDGRFGCCVHPKGREHRKQIFALAGEGLRHSDRSFKVRIAATMQCVLPLQSVTASLEHMPGTLGTAISKSETETEDTAEEIGTLGAGILKSHAYGREEDTHVEVCVHMCKDKESGVLSVPTEEKLPYFTPGGTLVIPFDSPERYHWWKGGQSIAKTRQEILE